MDILEAEGITIPDNVKSADILTHYAVQTRYPSPFEEISRKEYREAVALATEVLCWAEIVIAGEE